MKDNKNFTPPGKISSGITGSLTTGVAGVAELAGLTCRGGGTAKTGGVVTTGTAFS